MPARVTLKVTEGPTAGQEFLFDERTSCIMGRAKDCQPRIPNDREHATISRHHCLLDINPPGIRVRDFGSLNGTWVNGKKIGQREKGMTPEEGQQMTFPEYDLEDGDELKLSHTVFGVSVYVPAVCEECGEEIPDSERAEADCGDGVYQCAECRKKADKEGRKATPSKKARCCARCGRDVSNEIGEHWRGEYVCLSCREDPEEILKKLLNLARSGQEDLAAIKGYEVVEQVDRGGFGAIYRARHEESGEEVALKVMLPQVAAQQDKVQMFLRETENAMALRHPNVVELRDYGCSDGTFFFTMEFCEGGNVANVITGQGGKLPLEEAMDITLQALDGLEYAHNAQIPNVRLKGGTYRKGHGLVHRDIKPQNIFLTGSGSSRVAKVGDYGLAKAFEFAGLSGYTRSGTAMGTPVFMPRQQVINFRHAEPEVDVWAMAASLYFMLTGQFPRNFPLGAEPWKVVLETAPVPIHKRDRSVPRKLAKVIDKALVDRPEIHFKSAAALKKALEKVF